MSIPTGPTGPGTMPAGGPYALDIDLDAPLFVISIAAELAGMHPQTLRQYDRMGIVIAERTSGGGRRYSLRHVHMLRAVQRLSQDEGINLAGVKRILDLERQVSVLEQQLRQLLDEVAEARAQAAAHERATAAALRREVVPTGHHHGTVVVWRPQQGSYLDPQR